MKLLGFTLLATLTATSALADGPSPYACTVTDFLDDSRYPLDDAAIARNRTMLITLIDAGDRVLIETQLPDEEVQSLQLPVTDRSADHVRAEAGTAPYIDFVDWLIGPPATGTLIHQTYEADNIWRFTCDR